MPENEVHKIWYTQVQITGTQNNLEVISLDNKTEVNIKSEQ